MHDLVALYRFALRSGDRPLAQALTRALGSDPELSREADVELQRLPRGPARWSAAGERVVLMVMRRLGSLLP